MAGIQVALNLSKDSEKFLRQFPEKFKERFYKGLKKAMLHAEAKAKASFKGRVGGLPSPAGGPPAVVSGNLRRSIQNDIDVKGDDVIGVLFSNVIYSRALELGYPARNLLPRPYLEPAIRDNIRTLEDIIEREILKVT
jgi:hypothetical protein